MPKMLENLKIKKENPLECMIQDTWTLSATLQESATSMEIREYSSTEASPSSN
jgi:hypothetical protein